MKTRFKKVQFLLKKISFYVPFTWYFVLFCFAAFLGYEWLQKQAGIIDSAYKDIFILLLRVSNFFGCIILCFGLLTVIFSFFFFMLKKKKSGIDFKITTPSNEFNLYKQPINLHIHPILKPFLGFIKIRLKYDQTHFSEKFSIIKQPQKKLFSTTIDGVYYWLLSEIKEYRVEQSIVYFEDFFQFFSFAFSIPVNTAFYTQPNALSTQIIEAFPRKTEDTSIRIQELKKVEGELINYKNFESNDDVRRIVWKIYAKNKDLVVRIPEIIDPYASHTYLYVSFYSLFKDQKNEVIDIPFLNYYKTVIWSVYKQLLQKGFEVRYQPDQNIPTYTMDSEEIRMKYAISVSQWQSENELKEYVKIKDASVVIVSSLSDANQVKELLERIGNDVAFVFVPLLESFNQQSIGNWLQWLFIQKEKDQMAVYKTSWSLSLLRLKIAKNEKQLKLLLEQYQKSTIVKKTV